MSGEMQRSPVRPAIIDLSLDVSARHVAAAEAVGPRGLATLISDHAARAPTAPVLFAPGRPPLSYGRLWGLVKMMAELLNGFGIGPGDPVALIVPDGPEAAA